MQLNLPKKLPAFSMQAISNILFSKKFTDEEESVLWRCMNAKTCPVLNEELRQIVDNNLETVQVPLYRGVSKSLLKRLEKLSLNGTMSLDRVTSFSEDLSIAKDFASFSNYGTYAIIKIENPSKAFNYSKNMMDILLDAPIEEFHGADPEITFESNVDMIVQEKEWMLQSDAWLQLVDISTEKTLLTKPMTIYTMEFINE